jgi:general L-amino acid transport system permease protein
MGNRGISFGYGFLSQEASFDITFSMIDYDGSYSYGRAFLVGLLNTLLVSVIGIVLCTILGVTIGVGRLSENYLIAKAAEWYVEIFRNIPLLLQIFFWYYGALRLLPLPENAMNFNDISYLTIKGWYVPKFIWTNFSVFFSSVVIAIISIIFVRKYGKTQREQFGKHIPVGIISILILILFPLVTFLIGGVSLKFDYPELYKLTSTVYNFRGGISIIPELISLALALSMYTATFVAENVRAGIQGVGKGQKEAAASIGLTRGQILKLVVMPQALRIIIPPTTNQYLNLTKNSSLAAAIAYPDLVLVFAGTALMQTGRAIEIISITMGTYLFLSLTISILMNTYNKKMAIKEK